MFGNLLLSILVFWPFLGGLLAYGIGTKQKGLRDHMVLFTCVVELIAAILLLVQMNEIVNNICYIPEICGYGMYFSNNGFQVVHAVLAAFMWLVAVIFSKEYMQGKNHNNRYYLFVLFTLGATMGVFLSAKLYTTFIFFEIMSFTSFVWVAQEETKEALDASHTYLAIAVLGGLVMLMGLFILYTQAGTLQITKLMDKCYVIPDKTYLYIAGACIVFGFGAKAGIFGLHVWMGDSYTHSPAPTSALLSGILSKTGILGIMIVTANVFYYDKMWGAGILNIGLLTMVLGAILAVFSINLKNILAFSSMSQIGFILVGVGMSGLLGAENTLAVRGSILHMLNHSFIKLILFTIAGIIFLNIGKLNLNEIRGYGKNKKVLKYTFLVAALGIGGIPLFNGYVSKTLLHESIVEAIHLGVLNKQYLTAVEWIFLTSGGFTIAYMTKAFVAIFIENNVEENVQNSYNEKVKYIGTPMKCILVGCAVLLVVIGIMPNLVADPVADMTQGFMYAEKLTHDIAYFSMENLEGALITIGIGGALYYILVRQLLMKTEGDRKVYKDSWPVWFNVEHLIYRPLMMKILPVIMCVIFRVFDSIVDGTVVLIRKTIMKDEKLPTEREEGTVLSDVMGTVANWGTAVCNMTIHKNSPNERDYVHYFAVKNEEFRENNMIISRSMSFGLVLFCLGLSATLIYMLF